jgi:hypothetical protein
MKEYKVMASHFGGTYNAGRYVANSKQDAINQARDNYRNSSLGRTLKDCNSFTFYCVDKFDFE